MNTVYWSVFDNDINLIHHMPPIPIRDKYRSINVNNESNFNLCPAYFLEANKIYNLLAPFDYILKFENNSVITDDYNQEVFNKFFVLDDYDLKLFQLKIDYLFFTENPCIITVNPPYFTNSDISKNCNYIPASYDISCWLRNISVSGLLKTSSNIIKLKQGDEILSVKFDFNNSDKIQFKKFYISPRLDHIYNTNLNSRIFMNKKVAGYLDLLYKKFTASKIKTAILREIKSNLLE